MLRSIVFACSLVTLAACAGGGVSGSDDAGGRSDAGGMAGDGGPGEDAGRRDAGSTMCPPGRHPCGGGCIDDQPNEPENGCRLGCGEPCPVPAGGMAACSPEGTCTIGCTPPFRREGEMCVCAARTCEDMGFECGAPDDGCGMTLDCGTCAGGAACTDGRCACVRDEREANDSSTEASVLGSYTDEPRSGGTWGAFTLHAASDEDWFRFAIDNARNSLGDNPHVRVTVRDFPAGHDYDLGVWYLGNGDCDEAVEIMAGSADNTIGRGAVGTSVGGTSETVEILVDCAGVFASDEDGTIWVRVHARSWSGDVCAPYTLQVEVF